MKNFVLQCDIEVGKEMNHMNNLWPILALVCLKVSAHSSWDMLISGLDLLSCWKNLRGVCLFEQQLCASCYSFELLKHWEYGVLHGDK
jgi:hypothetical protein